MATLAMQNDQGIVGVPTGLSDLDEKLGGLHKSDLVILAGRPSMGKTALATNIKLWSLSMSTITICTVATAIIQN
mgnify:CR=1 FL=1